MTDTLTILSSINNIKNFFADIDSTSNTYYFFVGRPNPWENDSQPPSANNTYAEMESVWGDMVYGKLLGNNNLAYLCPNHQWVSNTVYAVYDQNSPIFGTNFYVVTSDYSVYKCIDNNNQSPSTIQPSLHSLTGTFQTSDGYTWKYLYTIPTNANTLFTSSQYIPVVPNTYVANNAVPGTIDVIRVENGGNNWQGFLTGYINSIVSATQVQFSGGNAANNFYVGSQIYLAGGLGGGQVREIIGYNGATGIATVNSAFSTVATIQLSNTSGSFESGYQFIQNYANVSYVFSTGSFNLGDSVYQSDGTVNGYVGYVNSSSIGIYGIGSNFSSGASPQYPIIDIGSSPVAQTGLVTVVAGSNQITATTANLSLLSVNSFVQVGSNNFNNVRRVASITNSTVATVSVPFNANLTANALSVIPRAIEPSNSFYTSTNGNITFVNLSGLEASYGNVQSATKNYIVGEFVELFNSSNVSLAANGIVAYVNSSTIILSNTNGSFSGNNFLLGTSSNTYAELFSVESYPSIAVSSSLNTWQAGIPAWVYNGTTIEGNATILGVNFVPSPQTPFIISPLISINGDGSNALAYALVNNAPNSPNNISEIVVLSKGINYTVANVSASANNLFGSGANLYPVISPANGHGADSISELGATMAGIAVTVNNFSSENLFFPPYGSYRRYGIIKNPLFQNINLTVGPQSRQNLHIINPTGSFVDGEIVFESAANAAGKVVFANASNIQLEDISGTFTANQIIGLQSNATAYILSTNGLINFTLTTNSLPLYEGNDQVAVMIDILSNTNLFVTNVSGKLESNIQIYDPTTNAYGLLTNVLTSNGNLDVTSSFGNTFNQTSRVTLSQNSITKFQVGEEVSQPSTNASGLILSANGDMDFIITNVSGTFSGGLVLTDANTSGNGYILWANTSYLKLSGVSGTFGVGDQVSTISANANISQVLTVLTLANTSPTPFQTNSGYNIVGANSGAIGVSGIVNTISQPQLVRGTGEVLYVNDLSPFTINTSSKEAFLLVLSF